MIVSDRESVSVAVWWPWLGARDFDDEHMTEHMTDWLIYRGTRMPLSHLPSNNISLPILQLVSARQVDSILAHMLSQILYSHRYSNGSLQLLLLTSSIDF